MTTIITAEQIEAAARKFAGLEPGTAWEDVDLWGLGTAEEWAEKCRARVREIFAAASIACASASPGPDRCTHHEPVQHRDNKPPWCNTCGEV